MDKSGTATRAKPNPLNPLMIPAINTIIPLIPIVVKVNSIIKLSLRPCLVVMCSFYRYETMDLVKLEK